ncbi:TOBE domain-containing protein [Enhygromyxa salina]|uniref:TOBE domain-containing protein n=1 Tax=Enhygromyxa salina TaxID=215803 RepID=UPI0011B24A42|nr:TOBE domain-containing protein [Enhygromyxa salina]
MRTPKTEIRVRLEVLIACLCVSSTVACTQPAASNEHAALASATVASRTPTHRAAPAHPEKTASGPPLGLEPAATATLEGEVAEVLSAGSYTYFQLRTDAQDRWIVIMGAGPEPGARVRVSVMGERAGFYSPRLDRHFASLSFATIDNQTEGPT